MDTVLGVPFALTSYGSIAVAYSEKAIWESRVKIAVLTANGERVMNPTYGTQVSKSAFESVDTLSRTLQNSIEDAFRTHLTDLNLLNVNITSTPQAGTVVAEINYEIPTGEEVTTVIKHGIINRFGEIVQEF